LRAMAIRFRPSGRHGRADMVVVVAAAAACLRTVSFEGNVRRGDEASDRRRRRAVGCVV